MKKNKILYILIITFILSTFLVGCGKENIEKSDGIKFKEEYESLNETENASGLAHRTLNIDSDNPFIYQTTKELIQKIENKETFYVYFGSSFCPWCRSVIASVIEVAKENNINQIYYIDIWDGDHVEILRDTYVLNAKGTPEMSKKGSDDYYVLLKYLDNVLDSYTLTDKDGNTVEVGEKRIFAPSFIYIEEGNAIKMTTGISDRQTSSRAELTPEILQDEEEKFTNFFSKLK